MVSMNKILIVEASFYLDIAEELLSGALAVVADRGFPVEKISKRPATLSPKAASVIERRHWRRKGLFRGTRRQTAGFFPGGQCLGIGSAKSFSRAPGSSCLI